MEQIMQQNLLLYGVTALGILGVVSQVFLRIVYGKLIRDMERPALAKGKYMKHLTQRYNTYRRTQTGMDSINIFIQKSMMEYKFMGMNLHTWHRMGAVVFALSAALGVGGWYLAGTIQMTEAMRQNYLWAVLASALLVTGAYGITDTGYQRKYLETGLRSLFTNSSTRSVQEVDMSDPPVRPERRPVPALKSPMGQRKRKSKIIETQAQRDKRELKENLAKIKEGIAETAATEKKKERNAEILKQMDPSEQERVIREVLREFL